MWQLVASGAITLLLLFAGVLAVAYVRYRAARRQAQRLLPQKGEVWMMDGKPLYIKETARHGVMLLTPMPGGEPHVWWDTWNDWNQRVRNRVVFRTAVAVSTIRGG